MILYSLKLDMHSILRTLYYKLTYYGLAIDAISAQCPKFADLDKHSTRVDSIYAHT